MSFVNAVRQEIFDWAGAVAGAWDRFWFTATDPATYCLTRLLAGAMLFYTHLVWTLELESFFGSNAWISTDLLRDNWKEQGGYYWSHWLWIESPAAIWTVHILALVVLFCFMIGLFSRVTSVAAYLITLSYMHRAQIALFGLDQVNVMLALYLMIGPSGACYSVDSWLRRRRGDSEPCQPSVSANIGVRLIQIHMCVIYFFAGTRKLVGDTWWDGTAMWGSVANLEYQSLDLTWMAGWPLLVAFFTHLTVLFEITYFALVWPRLTRPIVLLLAIWLHLGIVLCMGMATFGLAMLIGNLAFVSPRLVRSLLDRRRNKQLSKN